MPNESVDRFNQLDDDVKDMLSKMEPDHVQTLKYLATIPRDELRGLMKAFRDLRAIGKFTRWLILTILAIFLATVALYENVLKVLGYMKGPPS